MRKVIWLLFIFYVFNSLVAFSQPAEKKEINYNNPQEVNNLPPQDIANGIEQGKINPKIVDDRKLASALKESNQIATKLGNDDLARALRQDTSLIDRAKNPQLFGEINSRIKEKPEFLNLDPELKKKWFANYEIEDKGGSIASFDGKSKIKTLGPKSDIFDVQFIAKNYPGSTIDISGALKLPNGDEISNAEITAVADDKPQIKIAGVIGQLKMKDATFFPSEELFYNSREIIGKGIYAEHENGLKLKYTGFLTPIEGGFRGIPISDLNVHADNGLKIPLEIYGEKMDVVSNREFCSRPITCVAVDTKTGQIDVIRNSETYPKMSFVRHDEPVARAPNDAGAVGASPRLSFTAPNGITVIQGKEIKYSPPTNPNPSHVGDLYLILNAPVQIKKEDFKNDLPAVKEEPALVRQFSGLPKLVSKIPGFKNIEVAIGAIPGSPGFDPKNLKKFTDRLFKGEIPNFDIWWEIQAPKK